MLEVKKSYVDCHYINDYWKDNLIIDNLKTPTKNLTEEVYDNLDNYNTNKNNYNTNNNNYYVKTTYNNQSQNGGYYKKPYENRNFHKNTSNVYTLPTEPRYKEYNNRNTNKEYTLSTESRNKEYYNGQRKILMDSFSKPKLL